MASNITTSTIAAGGISTVSINESTTSEKVDKFIPSEAEQYTFVVIASVAFIAGIVGNGLVLKGSKRVSFFAKRNAYIFVGLALSDILVCLLRGPTLVYVSFQTDGPESNIACGIWAFSHTFVFISILTNAILATERRMIIVSFQRYLVFFTPGKVLVVNIIIWCFVTLISVAVFTTIHETSIFDTDLHMCSLVFSEIPGKFMPPDVINTVICTIFGGVPILLIVCSYVSIVMRIARTDLLKIDGLVEHALYSRLVNVSLIRILLSVLTWPPFLIFVAIFPVVPQTTWYIRYARLADYLVLIQSSISPFITLHDTDFREASAKKRWRFCSTIKSRTNSFKQHSFKGSKNGGCMTSGDFRTMGQPE